jgi:hypothetical protein
MTIDPNHCRCFSISKKDFVSFKNKLQSYGYTEPLLEEDHGQIFGFTKSLSQFHQIHIKLLKDGRIESEIEYSPEYPFAHLNSTHSFSAHQELNLVLLILNISFRTKQNPPISCIHRKIILANNPTKLVDVLKLGGIAAFLEIVLNDGKITSKVIDVISKEYQKNLKRKKGREKYLNFKSK